jgi:hypothetical protein
MKQKIVWLFVATAILSVSTFAQKEMLTKEETVNYLNKKLQEVDGRELKRSYGTFRYSDLFFRMKGDDLELKYTENLLGGKPCYSTFVFNPAHISKLVPIHDKIAESAVKGIRIDFLAKTARSSICVTILSDTNQVFYPYFSALPENRVRIERALLHLRDLAKAEEEPFGN